MDAPVFPGRLFFAASGVTMLSEHLRIGLSSQIVGQERAVRAMTRAVIRHAGFQARADRRTSAYLFLGPTWTGKTEMVKALSRALYGDSRGACFIHCSELKTRIESMKVGFEKSVKGELFERILRLKKEVPLPIVAFEEWEKSPQPVRDWLLVLLEEGILSARRPDGLLVVLIADLAAKEMEDICSDSGSIGFQFQNNEENDVIDDKIYTLLSREAEEAFGTRFLSKIDGTVIFRRLKEEHLPYILHRALMRLSQYLGMKGVSLEVKRSARAFLIRKGAEGLQFGAMKLSRSVNKYLEFPLADLMTSGRIDRGDLVTVSVEEDRLQFSVMKGRPSFPTPAGVSLARPCSAI